MLCTGLGPMYVCILYNRPTHTPCRIDNIALGPLQLEQSAGLGCLLGIWSGWQEHCVMQSGPPPPMDDHCQIGECSDWAMCVCVL